MLIKSNVQQLPDGYLDRTPWFQYILLSICFPMWGMAASLNDVLISQFKSLFTLSDFASAFVQSAFYGGYFLIAIPASRVIRRFSYKTSILIGLVCYIAGCLLFFPASHMATYGVFLFALFSIAVGLSFLETSCNTYSSMIGPKEGATLRLNISQTFTPVGFLSGILLGKYLIFTDGEALEKQMEVMTPAQKHDFALEMLQRTLQPYQYIIMVLIVLLIVVAVTQFPRCKPLDREAHETQAGIGETLRYLAGNGRFKFGILAQFAYVGVQTAVWSFTIRLALQLDSSLNERAAANYVIYAFVAFFIGKCIANFLMKRYNENQILLAYCAIGMAALMYVICAHNISAIYAAILTSAVMGPGWPTIYAHSLDAITDKRYTETGGAVIVMAIIGGAVVPLIQGLVSDLLGSMQLAFVVSLLCFAIMFAYFWNERRIELREQKIS